MKSLRIVFAGTPEFAASVLDAVLKTEHQVVAAYTQPDRPAGRGRKLTASPVKQLALNHDIPVYQPANFKLEEDVQALNALQADIMVVVAYGLLLPKSVLDAPKLGCINVHASLLPRWRGAAPIQRAIAAGDLESGVTIMQMDIGLDTGAMLRKVTTAITNDDTGGTLHDRLAELGAAACVDSLDDFACNRVVAEQQDDRLANYAHKLSKDEAKIDWHLPAATIARTIRAFNPWPVAHTTLNGDPLRVWFAQSVDNTDISDNMKPGSVLKADKQGIDIATSSGILRISQLQLAGGKSLPVADILNAKKGLFERGNVLGQ